MDAINDDNLRRMFNDKRTSQDISAEPPSPKPVALPCHECSKGIAYTGPEDRKIIEAWNSMGSRFTCLECREAREQRRREKAIEAAREQRQAELLAVQNNLPGALARCGVPAHWQNASFDYCNDLPPKLADSARLWAEAPYGIIYLYGPPGVGKSYLAVAILRAILESGVLPPRACRYVGEREFLDALKATYDCSIKSVSPRLLSTTHFRDVELLLYDDMGTARQTDWTRGEISTLIEHRHANNLLTIITSNIEPNDLAQSIDGRVLSRIAEYRMMLAFPPCDLRVNGRVHVSDHERG